VWQWIHNPRGILDDGRKVTNELVRGMIQEELKRIREERGDTRFAEGKFDEARRLFDELVAGETLEEFLTLKAYDLLS
jgi:malate synthase